MFNHTFLYIVSNHTFYGEAYLPEKIPVNLMIKILYFRLTINLKVLKSTIEFHGNDLNGLD